jgi:hypothetical protein
VDGRVEMKPFYKSLTFWGIIASIVGLTLAGVGRGEPLLDILNDPSVQETIGELLLTLGIASSFYGRMRAQGPMTLRRQEVESAPAPEVVAPPVVPPKALPIRTRTRKKTTVCKEPEK